MYKKIDFFRKFVKYIFFENPKLRIRCSNVFPSTTLPLRDVGQCWRVILLHSVPIQDTFGKHHHYVAWGIVTMPIKRDWMLESDDDYQEWPGWAQNESESLSSTSLHLRVAVVYSGTHWNIGFPTFDLQNKKNSFFDKTEI